GPVPKRALNRLCRATPNPFEVRYAIISSNAASVTLKRRSETLAPKRKLSRLKRKVLPPQCLRRRKATFPSVSPREGVVDESAVATGVVDVFTGFPGSYVMRFFSSPIDSIQAPLYSRLHYRFSPEGVCLLYE